MNNQIEESFDLIDLLTTIDKYENEIKIQLIEEINEGDTEDEDK